MLPLCLDQGVSAIPWSPLARGRLTRPWSEQTNRSENDAFGRSLYGDDDQGIVAVVIDIAKARGVPAAQVALAWVLANPAVASPIVGATKEHHLSDAIAALDVHLEASEIERLEENYRARGVAGFQ
jgi:aryl-alcohol dehydrogenase-like predicted oxidoreductase